MPPPASDSTPLPPSASCLVYLVLIMIIFLGPCGKFGDISAKEFSVPFLSLLGGRGLF